jgi:hypothetical protein
MGGGGIVEGYGSHGRLKGGECNGEFIFEFHGDALRGHEDVIHKGGVPSDWEDLFPWREVWSLMAAV